MCVCVVCVVCVTHVRSPTKSLMRRLISHGRHLQKEGNGEASEGTGSTRAPLSGPPSPVDLPPSLVSLAPLLLEGQTQGQPPEATSLPQLLHSQVSLCVCFHLLSSISSQAFHPPSPRHSPTPPHTPPTLSFALFHPSSFFCHQPPISMSNFPTIH